MEIAVKSVEIRHLKPGDKPSLPATPIQTGLFKSNDRVALIGSGMIERARLNGELETSLQLSPGKEVNGLRFRNLGWSGDSVFNDSRAYFGKPNEGRKRLRKLVSEWQPQVVMLNYGASEALSVDQGWTDDRSAAARSAGGMEKSLAVFIEGYQQLIDDIKKDASKNLREIVIISPPPFENLGAPLPDHKENNARLAKFCDALRSLAEKNQVRFVDLFAIFEGDKFSGELATTPLTHDGLHFSDKGYQQLAQKLALGLGYPSHTPSDAAQPAIEKMRQTIIEKNRLFFHRWRPANETYLFLFRKREQGENAKEIPQFDPLISAQEKQIESLKLEILKSNK